MTLWSEFAGFSVLLEVFVLFKLKLML